MRFGFARAFALALLVPSPRRRWRSAAEPGEVNIYSYRQPYLINPLLKEFTDETGIKVNVIFAEKGLIERIQAEGRNSPADLLLTVDVGNLTQATDAGIAQPIQSPVLDAAIPPAYRAADGQWIGLTRRARVVYASKERVKQDTITYEELADPKWRGKICIRSGQHVYNVALIASMIAAHGEAWTRDLAERREGQSRAQARRRRPAPGQGRLCRRMRYRRRQHLLHGRHAARTTKSPSRRSGRTRSTSCSPTPTIAARM